MFVYKKVVREASKKVILLLARPLRGGWGKSLATKKKSLFLKLEKSPQKIVTTKPKGGGGEALVAGPLKKLTSFEASLTKIRVEHTI